MVFECVMEVRDYECDLADGVNNSVYMNYLEHARHSLLKQGGIDFAALARQKIGLVIARAEVDFTRSLMSGDQFAVRTIVKRQSKLRYEFHQAIYRLPDEQVMVKAVITGVPINAEGRPRMPAELEPLILALCEA
jgi:acyl-CoA thioester hydrolase